MSAVYTIVRDDGEVRLCLGGRTRRVHSLESLFTAKARRTQFANRFPDFKFRILGTFILYDLSGEMYTRSEWMNE